METDINYYSTHAKKFTVDEWLKMLEENRGFTPPLLEALYVLIIEMAGKGSAKQISEITGRSYQGYNSSMAHTIKRLRKKGYIFVVDIREDNKKERYWSHFFKVYYENGLFIWEVKDTLQKAFIKYVEKFSKDEIESHSNETVEGTRRYRIHSQIERNSAITNQAKKTFIEKHGALFCEACDFSFNKIYDIDFIEAHHILSLYKGKRVTKESDLIMLCANCHRAVHHKKWNDKSIDEFLEYMKNPSI